MPSEYAKHGLTPISSTCWSDLWSMPRAPANFWQPYFDRYDATVFAFVDDLHDTATAEPGTLASAFAKMYGKARAGAGRARRSIKSLRS